MPDKVKYTFDYEGKNYSIDAPKGLTAVDIEAYMEEQKEAKTLPVPPTPTTSKRLISPGLRGPSSASTPVPEVQKKGQRIVNGLSASAVNPVRQAAAEGTNQLEQMFNNPEYTEKDIRDFVTKETRWKYEGLDEALEARKKGEAVAGTMGDTWDEVTLAPTVSEKGGFLRDITRSRESNELEMGKGLAYRLYLDWSGAADKTINDLYPDASPEEKERLSDEHIAWTFRKWKEANAEEMKDDSTPAWLIGQVLDIDPVDAIPVGRATKAIKPVLKTLEKAGQHAGVNVAGDMVYQTTDIMGGLRDGYDPQQTLSAGVFGGLLGAGGQHVGNKLTARAAKKESAVPLEGDTAVARFEQELQAAKPLSKQEADLLKEFRSEKAQAMREISPEVTGTDRKALLFSKLSGKAEKIDAPSIKEKFTQQDIEDLHSAVRDAFPKSQFDEANAYTALAKVLGAEGMSVPTPSEIRLLSEVFNPEIVKNLTKIKPLKNQVGNNLLELASVPRAVMSSADLSAPLRQGAFLIRRPGYWKALPDMVKAFWSEENYSKIMSKIDDSPNRDLMKESGLGITDIDGHLGAREEAFMSSFADKLPFVRASNRAYSGFLNKLRASVFDDSVNKALKRGNDIRNNPEGLEALSAYINAASGRGNLHEVLEKASPILTATLFSPKLASSRIQLLTNPMLYARLPKGLKREAALDLAAYSATALTLLGLADMAVDATVEWDMRSPDFAKIKVGNTRYDILGGFQQYLRLGAVLGTGQKKSSKGSINNLGEGWTETELGVLATFLRSKASPNASYIVDAIDGKNIIGEEFQAGPDAMKRLIPMVAQDMAEGYEDEGVKGAAKVTPAILGVGVSTYGTPRDLFGREPTPGEEADPAAAEVGRLSGTLEDGKSVIGYINKGHIKKFDISDEELVQYQELAGKYTLGWVTQLQESGEWDDMTDEDRIDEVKDIAKDMRELAREELFPEYYGTQE